MPQQTAPEVDRFAGALIGQCLGDALGFPVEGMPPAVCALLVDRIRQGRVEIGRPPFAFGQYTDDSQLAREWVESFVGCAGWNPADYAGRIAAIFSEERIVGRGKATENAARRLAAGVPWDRAGEPPPTAGNGSAMRAAPVGLAFWNDPRRLVEVAVEQGRITHADPRCSAGAAAVAGATALALRLGPIDAAAFASELAAHVEAVSSEVAGALRRLPEFLLLEPDDAVHLIAPLGKDPSIPERWPGISPFVTGTVVWSLYAFLRSPDDFLETACTAIRVGGDVDTTAAIAGAISGAYVGLRGLPDGLARRVNDQGTWDFEALVGLAGDLHRLVVDSKR